MKTSNSTVASPITDAQLVAKFQKTGDGQVFSMLYNRYFSKVKTYCIKSLGDEQSADDAAQDVFLKVFEKLGTLQNPQLWIAWLFSITRNEVLNIHKRNARSHMEPVESCLSLTDDFADLEALEEKERKLNSLAELLEEVPAGRMLKMKYLQGRSIEQLCRELDMNESAVKMRLLRARQSVVQFYERQYARA